MTQKSLILDYLLEHGSITTREAYEQFGITRLAARVHELIQAGYNIKSQFESGVNRYGKPVTYSRYTLIDEKRNKAGSVIL